MMFDKEEAKGHTCHTAGPCDKEQMVKIRQLFQPPKFPVPLLSPDRVIWLMRIIRLHVPWKFPQQQYLN